MVELVFEEHLLKDTRFETELTVSVDCFLKLKYLIINFEGKY